MVSSSLTHQADGVDCTAIQGISDVLCFRGQCVVHQCMPGYELNALKHPLMSFLLRTTIVSEGPEQLIPRKTFF
jgi:hypothetical protein